MKLFIVYLMGLGVSFSAFTTYADSLSLNYELYSEGKKIGSSKQEVVFGKTERRYIEFSSIFLKGWWWGKYELKALHLERYDYNLQLLSATSKSYENKQANWIELSRDKGQLKLAHLRIKKEKRGERERLASLSGQVGNIGLEGIKPFNSKLNSVYSLYRRPNVIGPVGSKEFVVTSVRLPEYLLQKFEEESVVAGSDLGEALVYDNEIMEVQSHQVEYSGVVRVMVGRNEVRAHSFSLKQTGFPAAAMWVARHSYQDFPYMLRYSGIDSEGEIDIRLKGLNVSQ